MQTLYLLRHAKSSWANPALADIARPLNARGRRAAAAMGKYFHDENIRPALVLSSPSVRTRETLDYLFEGYGEALAVDFDETLYLAPPAVIIETAENALRKAGSVMIIGHNPGLQTAARALAESGDETMLARLEKKFPTAALAEIALPEKRLVRFVRPKDF